MARDWKSPSPQVIVLLNAFPQESQVPPGLEWANVLRTSVNLGFAGGCNFAARYATAEYLVFLNDDAIVEPGWLGALIETADGAEHIGAVGSKILFPNGVLQEAGSVIWRDARTSPIGRGESAGSRAHDVARRVDFCSANGLLVRRSSWSALGGFDERFYPAYYEDVDLCFALKHRLRQAIIYQPRSVIRHAEAASTEASFRSFLFDRNAALFADKWRNELKNYPDRAAAALHSAASVRDAHSPNILILDDRPPKASLGSGYGRFETLAEELRFGSYHGSFLSTNSVAEPAPLLQDAGIAVLPDNPKKHLKEHKGEYDVVIISRPHNYERFSKLVRAFQPRAKLIYDAEALFHKRLYLQSEIASKDTKRALFRDAAKMLSIEERIARESDQVVCTSIDEAAQVRAFGAESVSVQLPLRRSITRSSSGFGSRRGAAFVAGWLGGENTPNADALIWFLAEILPLILAQIPDFELIVTGASPPQRVQVAANANVRFAGELSDLDQLYDGVRLAIVPLRFGAGTKVKTLEALQYGVPIVATPVGAEGMALTDGPGTRIAATGLLFAEWVVKTHESESEWLAARSRIADEADRLSKLYEPWEKIITRACEGQ